MTDAEIGPSTGAQTQAAASAGVDADAAASPIRAVLIGFGVAGGLFHAPFIAADPSFELVAIVTGNPARAARAREEHAAARILPDAEALWNAIESGELDVDLVVVASPSGLHFAHAERALRLGRHVVVDKPFVPTVAEGETLIALAAEQGVVLTVFQNRRWDGDFQTVAELVRSGRLGEVRRFESRFGWWEPEAPASWKATTTAADAGGILYDLGPHLIDQALRLFGPVREVYAELDSRRTGSAADDDAFVALEHESGVRSHLRMSCVEPAMGTRFRVTGSQGAYLSEGLDGQEAALGAGARPGDEGFGVTPEEAWGEIVCAGSAAERVPTLRGDYGGFYAGLADAILRGGAAPVDPADSVEGLRIIARAREAAARGAASSAEPPAARGA